MCCHELQLRISSSKTLPLLGSLAIFSLSSFVLASLFALLSWLLSLPAAQAAHRLPSKVSLDLMGPSWYPAQMAPDPSNTLQANHSLGITNSVPKANSGLSCGLLFFLAPPSACPVRRQLASLYVVCAYVLRTSCTSYTTCQLLRISSLSPSPLVKVESFIRCHPSFIPPPSPCNRVPVA